MKRYNLEKCLENEIKKLAEKNSIKKVILFGSRSRCSNNEKSDIDLAVSGGDILDFSYDVEEKTHTLLMFDIVNLDRGITSELQEEIERDGVVIYEKV